MTLEPRAGSTGFRPSSLLGPYPTLEAAAFLQNSHKIVILRACDFFDLFVFFAPDQMLFNPLQKGVILRGGVERSASQIYRITEGLWRGVEGPRRCLLAGALRSFPATDYKGN